MDCPPGVFCCGPVPVLAIKEGELTLKYDAPFVYAEVNADVVTLLKLNNGKMVKIRGNTTEVGHDISTKAVGKDERHDITDLYKYPEGKRKCHPATVLFVVLCFSVICFMYQIICENSSGFF